MRNTSDETNRHFVTRARELPTERMTRTQIALWVVLGYLFYAGIWWVLESYGRYRFHVLRDADIAHIMDKRAHLIAVAQKAAALGELEEWLPYRVAAVVSVTIWGLLAIAAAVAMFRVMSRNRKVSIANVKILAVTIFVNAGLVVMCGVAAPLLIQFAWERYPWLSW